jgi:NAD(P)-dependent dehydrogenase (short-subunit alcohol dehydrogenase family)
MTQPSDSQPAAERRVAVVTGSTSGIGRATAERLAADGYDLVIHGLDETGLKDAVGAVERLGASTRTVTGDICDPAVARQLADAAFSGFGRLDALVNNAGAGFFSRVTDMTVSQWRGVFGLHVDAVFRTTQQAFPLLKEAHGAVVNISSVAAIFWLPERVAYSSAKSAVMGMTRTMACEWAAEGVRVNAVAPGTIETPLVAENFRTGRVAKDPVVARIPMKRLGRPSEIANVISFLLSESASYVTGQIIFVDGGWTSSGGW